MKERSVNHSTPRSVTYLGLEYGDCGDMCALWFRLGCEGLLAFVSRPPPGEIFPASAFSEWSMAGGGRRLRCGLVTLLSQPGLVHPLPARRPSYLYLQIRGAGAPTPPASSPPDAIALIKSVDRKHCELLHACPCQGIHCLMFETLTFRFFTFFTGFPTCLLHNLVGWWIEIYCVNLERPLRYCYRLWTLICGAIDAAAPVKTLHAMKHRLLSE